jgi:hypothetical protein
MPQVNIQLIHNECRAYLDDPILKPFEPIDLSNPQRAREGHLDGIKPPEITLEVLLVSQKKKIVQEMLQAKSVDQIADILDRRDHGAVTNRLFLQKTNPSYLFWLLLQMQTRALLNQIHNSLNSFLLFLVLPITMVPISAGVIYFLGIALALISLYAVLSAGFQAYTTSVAFADLSQQFISKLELSATQDYDVKPITSLLQELGLNYDPEGRWLTDIIKNSNQLKDRNQPISQLFCMLFWPTKIQTIPMRSSSN